MGKLEDDYLIPPFSILDTKQGYWQLRKRQWLSLGLKSELGRDAGCLTYEEAKMQCKPILDAMNERMKVIALKHGKKPLVIKFAGLFR